MTERAPRMTVELTGELIEESKERDSSHCMIAEAVRAAHPGASRISVDLQTIRFTDTKKRRRYTYLTPRVAQIALIDFDQGRLPEPFKFRLTSGQVTASGSSYVRRGDEQSEAQRIARNRNIAKARDELKRARLVSQTIKDDGQVPDKIGGRPPPTTPFARRRAFGLRALER